MSSQFERISPVECRVNVEVPWSDVSPRLQKKMKELRRSVRMPGFRPGKAPLRMLERMYGEGVRHEVAQELVEATFKEAASEHQTVPLTEPRVDEHSYDEGKLFRYQARYEVAPVIEPKDYSGVPVFKLKVEADEEQVSSWLEDKRFELSELRPIEEERVTQDGDVWTIDIDGKWQDIDLSRKDVKVEMGKEATAYIPGLDKAMSELKTSETGEKRTLTFLPPQDKLREELKGTEVEIDVALREVKQRVLPELDDDFARDTELGDTLDELKDKVREMFREEADISAERDARLRLAGELLSRNEVTPAPSMVMREVEAQYNLQMEQLRRQGIDVSTLGQDREKAYEAMWPRAYGNVAAFLLLDAIGKKEEINVESSEVDEEIKALAEERNQNEGKLRASLQQSGEMMLLQAQIRENKIFEFLMEKAELRELPKEEYDAELEKYNQELEVRRAENETKAAVAASSAASTAAKEAKKPKEEASAAEE